jgi:DNA invertase Pin-like site-specific DNA recombinase
MNAALYIWVSTSDQNADLQVRELRAYVEHQGWEVAEVYQDVMSSSKASRPALNRLAADAPAMKFDSLLVLGT